MIATFWIVVYCLHPDLCYVSKDDGGIKPAQYATAAVCETATHGGREVNKNSTCTAVTAVSCFNGGSRCTYAPADETSSEMLKHLAPMPQ